VSDAVRHVSHHQFGKWHRPVAGVGVFHRRAADATANVTDLMFPSPGFLRAVGR
jgi:hypothetical protein